MDNYFQMNMTKAEIDAFSNLSLAHIGDGVFELLCRSFLCRKGAQNVGNLHRDTVKLVKATSQAAFAEKMLPHLTETELSYYRRGKNAHVHAVPKGASPADYQKATGVEAMFGYLHLSGQNERANEIFCTVMEELYGI
jgi:ribonuclease-3 family protein